jgi:uncharacterized protein
MPPKTYPLIAIALLFTCSQIQNAKAAGFDCAKAKTKIEIEICNSPELSAKDSEINTIYKDIYSKLSPDGKSILKKIR